MSISTKKNTIEVLDGPSYINFIKDLYGEDSDAYKALGYHDITLNGVSPVYDKDGNQTGYKADYTLGEQKFANTDWQDEIYRTAISHDHNLTISGGMKNMPYRLSLGYTNNQGIVKTSMFERYTASFNLSPTFLNDHLKFNINGKGMIAKNRYADGGAIGAARYMDPTKPVRYSNDVYNKYFGGYAQWYTGSNFMDKTWATTNNSNATENPVALLENKNDRATSKTFVGNIEVDYAIHGFEDLHLHRNSR